MANPKSTNVKPLPNYTRLSLPEMLAVQLKVSGATYQRIAAEMEAAYGFKRRPEAIRDWFRPDSGKLNTALDQYRHVVATESLKESQLLLMRFSLPAVVTLCKFLSHPNDRIRLKAAKAIVDLTIAPAGTSVNHSTSMPRDFMQANELPDELNDPADEELEHILREVRLAKMRIAQRQMERIPVPAD